jgi:hypothetical protein
MASAGPRHEEFGAPAWAGVLLALFLLAIVGSSLVHERATPAAKTVQQTPTSLHRQR